MALDLVVPVADLHTFLEDVAVTQAVNIRALTVQIDNTELHIPGEETVEKELHVQVHSNTGTQALWAHLQSLPRVLHQMTNLETFALVVVSRSSNEFWLPRDIITDIVKALPQRCCNVEIDTQGQDHPQAGSTHLCEAICHVLSRLNHLRLRLSTMCKALFNLDSSLMLQTVSVNCVGMSTLSSGTQICGSHDDPPGTVSHPTGIDAVSTLAQRLQILASQCPRLELAIIMDVTPNDYDDRSTHPCYNIRDVIANKTYASPFVNVWPFEDRNTLLRSREGRDVLGSRASIQVFAEGQPWKETVDGLRLPAMMFAANSSAYTTKELHLLTADAWKEQNPRRSCSLWNNERKTGIRLLESVTFDGLADHPVLKEATPDGWVRLEPETSDLYRGDG